MLSLVMSTIGFFVASSFIRRYFDDMGLPKGMTRGLLVFCLASAIAYGIAVAGDWLVPT